MPLFKKHHDAPVDTNYAGNPSDPNYAVASQYAPESNTYTGGATSNTHSSGFGTTVPQGNTTTGYYDPPQSAQPTTYDQNATGYNAQPGAGMTSNQPIHNDVGRGALASEPGHSMGGHTGGGMGTTTTGSTGSGLTGREHHAPFTGAQNVHNTAPTGMAGTTASDMSSRDARNLEMKGKAQQLVGMVLSSQSMRAKGNAKEQEAAAIRHHQTNMAEAEAHEAQARLARERAGQNQYH
ncbi:hypothetical protein OPQ81_004694 [Rhizoctonia solani]|nr:hypothetical protein OPQ81_004694 [Rhizoctonia solani]